MRSLHTVTLVLAGMIVLAGCKTAPKGGESAEATPDSLRTEENTPEASEKRAEAHARYASGVLYGVNDEPEKAATEFYQAALTDPADEDLVLEASQRLLQL